MIALLACLGLVVMMTVIVVASMAIENWPRLRTPAPVAAHPPDPSAPDPSDTGPIVGEAPGGDRSDRLTAAHSGAAPTVDSSLADVTYDGTAFSGPDLADDAPPERISTPPAGRPEGAIAIASRSIELRDKATADVLAGLLFAGLAASRRSGADRAAAWVTASATPPTADPSRLPPGVRLRGRTAKVTELLAHRDGGQVWVTLQPEVDIARGLARTPVTQPTLAGLVVWWKATQALPAVVEPIDAATIAGSIGAVRDVLDDTAWSEPVGRLHDALLDAAAGDEAVLVALAPDSSNETDDGEGTDSNDAAGREMEHTSPRPADDEPAVARLSGDPRRAAPTS